MRRRVRRDLPGSARGVARDRSTARSRGTGAPAIENLNRLAGNRAVARLLDGYGHAPPALQRLVYEPKSKTLGVPQSFADTQVHWDATNEVKWNKALDKATQVTAGGEEIEVTTATKSIAQLYDSAKATINKYLGRGLGGLAVGNMKVMNDEGLDKAAAFLVGKEAEDADNLKAVVRSAVAAPKQLLNPKQWVWQSKYWDADSVREDVEWSLAPADYIPELPDLPAAGTAVRDVKLWPKTCTLIALVKHKGTGPAFAKAGVRNPTADDLDTAVQALHDHYMRAGVQYDDESTRQLVMKDWGYRNIFTGPATYQQLPGLVELSSGSSYIFDIKGHTVKVTMKKAVKSDTVIDDVGKFFTFESDPDNYKGDEKQQQVLRIYQAG